MTATPLFTVGLLGHTTTSSNLGIGALTVADMRIVADAAAELGREVRFEVAAWREPNAPYVTGPRVDFHPYGRAFLTSPRGMYAMARRCDLVLDINGGDSFTDIYGPKRFLYELLGQRITLLAGTSLGFAPQTIGPFGRAWARRAAASVMRKSAFVFARDRLSSDYARQIAPRGVTLDEATDVAFLLPYTKPAPFGDGKVHVGINVSGLLFAGGYTGRNEFGLKMDYAALIRELVAHFTAMDDCRVHLISHVIRPDASVAREDDHAAALRLAEEFPSVIVETPAGDPGAAKSQIAAMDFFLGARMHACIAAFSSGVPVIPMAYSRKFIGLFGTLGYDRVADCRTEEAGEVFRKIVDGYRDRARLAAEIATASVDIEARLSRYRDAIRGVLERAG